MSANLGHNCAVTSCLRSHETRISPCEMPVASACLCACRSGAVGVPPMIVSFSASRNISIWMNQATRMKRRRFGCSAAMSFAFFAARSSTVSQRTLRGGSTTPSSFIALTLQPIIRAGQEQLLPISSCCRRGCWLVEIVVRFPVSIATILRIQPDPVEPCPICDCVGRSRRNICGGERAAESEPCGLSQIVLVLALVRLPGRGAPSQHKPAVALQRHQQRGFCCDKNLHVI